MANAMSTPRPVEQPIPNEPLPVLPIDCSEPIWDETNQTGIFQQNLSDPQNTPRTAPEAFFYHALQYGGYTGLWDTLASNQTATNTWWNTLFDLTQRIETTWNHLQVDFETTHNGWVYLAQHPYVVWENIILGCIARLQDEEWRESYVDRVMGLGHVGAAGAYLCVIAAKKARMATGALSERSGRFLSKAELKKLIQYMRRYLKTGKTRYDRWRRRINYAFGGKGVPKAAGNAAFLGTTASIQAVRRLEIKQLIAHFEKVVEDIQDDDAILPIFRCVQESGQTGGPIQDRAIKHRWNEGTTYMFGLLNAIMKVEFGDIYVMARAYAVIKNWDPTTDQTVMEAMLHFLGSTGIELAGTNTMQVNSSGPSKNKAPYDLALLDLFDVDMVGRVNEEYQYFRDLLETAESYRAGQLEAMRDKVLDFDQQLEDGAVELEAVKEEAKKKAREFDDLMTTCLASEEQGKSLSHEWQVLLRLLDATKPPKEDEKENLKALEWRRRYEYAGRRMFPVRYETQAQVDEDIRSAGIVKGLDGQNNNYIPPAGWHVDDRGGKRWFVHDGTGNETTMPVEQFLSYQDRYNKVALAAIAPTEKVSRKSRTDLLANEALDKARLKRVRQLFDANLQEHRRYIPIQAPITGERTQAQRQDAVAKARQFLLEIQAERGPRSTAQAPTKDEVDEESDDDASGVNSDDTSAEQDDEPISQHDDESTGQSDDEATDDESEHDSTTGRDNDMSGSGDDGGTTTNESSDDDSDGDNDGDGVGLSRPQMSASTRQSPPQGSHRVQVRSPPSISPSLSASAMSPDEDDDTALALQLQHDQYQQATSPSGIKLSSHEALSNVSLVDVDPDFLDDIGRGLYTAFGHILALIRDQYGHVLNDPALNGPLQSLLRTAKQAMVNGSTDADATFEAVHDYLDSQVDSEQDE